ncbi:MAG: hypothetical protein NTW16_02135 [Bacteroidetes bacterium]|nr:hypothetical protein [Bacteroidota bacterium]
MNLCGRTHDRKKIDLIEESGGSFNLFEFKWNKSGKQKSFDFFRSNYPVNKAEIITRKEMENFIIGPESISAI